VLICAKNCKSAGFFGNRTRKTQKDAKVQEFPGPWGGCGLLDVESLQFYINLFSNSFLRIKKMQNRRNLPVKAGVTK
jgi:hypothetical protein